jgi:hypothetical protein
VGLKCPFALSSAGTCRLPWWCSSSHPELQEGLQAGRVHVAGLFYDISTARVLRVTPDGISHLDPLPQPAIRR